MSDSSEDTQENNNKGELMHCDRHRILVVDDEKAVRTVFLQIISYGLPDCRVDIAVNGVEAVEAFRSVHYGFRIKR